MSLYKYVGPERIDILQMGRVRFTQPSLFNDPFECNPHVLELATKDRWRSIIAEQLAKRDQDFWNVVVEKHGIKESKEEYIKKLSGVTDFTGAFIESMADQGRIKSAAEVGGVLDDFIGIISLSEVFDDLLMWAHYGLNHTGFVIEFDAEHEFFTNKGEEDQRLSHPIRINYRSQRPSIVFDQYSAIDVIFTKSLNWIHEQEWRFVKALEDSDEILVKDSEKIHLFDLPFDCISSILFGVRMESSLKDTIRKLTDTNPLLSHIQLKQMQLDQKEYVLRIEEMPNKATVVKLK